MHSDMNKILIFCKIQIWYSEQFTITQITSSARECSLTRGCEILSLEMIQQCIRNGGPEEVRLQEVRGRAADWCWSTVQAGHRYRGTTALSHGFSASLAGMADVPCCHVFSQALETPLSAVLGECRLAPEAASVGKGVGMAAAGPPVSCLRCTR